MEIELMGWGLCYIVELDIELIWGERLQLVGGYPLCTKRIKNSEKLSKKIADWKISDRKTVGAKRRTMRRRRRVGGELESELQLDPAVSKPRLGTHLGRTARPMREGGTKNTEHFIKITPSRHI